MSFISEGYAAPPVGKKVEDLQEALTKREARLSSQSFATAWKSVPNACEVLKGLLK